MEEGSVETAIALQAGTDAAVASRDAEQGRQARIFDRAAWRDAALIWLATRLLFVAITYVGASLLRIPSYSEQRLPLDRMFSPWLGWDGANYAAIAAHGYAYPWTAAYFPLLPVLERALMPLVGGNAALAGLLVSNIASLGAFGLLRVLGEREFGPEVARRALLYLAVFPTAFFLAAPYTESLFLVFSIGAFLALRRGHWLAAGLCAAFATLDRPPGVLLAVPLLVEIVLRIRAAGKLPRVRELAAMAGGVLLPVAALVGFTTYLYFQFGSWSASSQAQAAGWGRGFAFPGVGFLRAGNALVQSGFDPSFFQVHILLDAVFTLLLIGLTVAAFRRLPLAYVLYCGALLTLILCTPQHNWYALGSNMRFLVVEFPLFLLLGRWGAHRRVDVAILAASLTLLALFTIAFVSHSWVA
jgi:Gpi18-like mannosyltransferase